jgi:hypothetical protein
VRLSYFVIAGAAAFAHAAAFAIGVTDARAQHAPVHVTPGSPPAPPPFIPTPIGASPPPDPVVDAIDWHQFFQGVAQAISGPSSSSGHLGGPVSLSMYGNSFSGIGASSSWSSGYRLSDTAGLISNPNALSPGYRSWNSGAGVDLTFDATNQLGLAANQRLWFSLGGIFDYDSTRYMSLVRPTIGSITSTGKERLPRISITQTLRTISLSPALREIPMVAASH